MKTLTSSVLVSLLISLLFVTGCKKTPVISVSERIAKAWSARTVAENGTTVYTRSVANPVRNYANFRLDLSQTPNATLVDYDGNRFTGQWRLDNDTQLTLFNLNPQPTGTTGTITFTIGNLSDTELVLTRTSASAKTGGTLNVYTLSNP